MRAFWWGLELPPVHSTKWRRAAILHRRYTANLARIINSAFYAFDSGCPFLIQATHISGKPCLSLQAVNGSLWAERSLTKWLKGAWIEEGWDFQLGHCHCQMLYLSKITESGLALKPFCRRPGRRCRQAPTAGGAEDTRRLQSACARYRPSRPDESIAKIGDGLRIVGALVHP